MDCNIVTCGQTNSLPQIMEGFTAATLKLSIVVLYIILIGFIKTRYFYYFIPIILYI